jgi:hypothetical protein
MHFLFELVPTARNSAVLQHGRSAFWVEFYHRHSSTNRVRTRCRIFHFREQMWQAIQRPKTSCAPTESARIPYQLSTPAEQLISDINQQVSSWFELEKCILIIALPRRVLISIIGNCARSWCAVKSFRDRLFTAVGEKNAFPATTAPAAA